MKILFIFFSENLDYALGWMVIHSLWQLTLIALIAGGLNIALRKKTAKLRYIVSNIALLMMLATSAATFYYHFDFKKQAEQAIVSPIEEPIQNIAAPTIQQITEITGGTPLSIEAFKDYFNQNLPLIVTIWLLGVTLFILKLLGNVSYIYYLKSRMNFPTDEYWGDMMETLAKRAGLKKTIDLVESAIVRTPVVVGHLKPMILFPLGVINRLSPQDVEAILAHEIAHVLRNDYLFNIFQSIVEALFYYHPAVWWLSSQVRNERESACDEIAIKLINSKLNYAKALVSIQEMAYFPLSPALAFTGQRKNQFLMRMQRILNQQQNKTNVMEKIIATLLIVGTLFGLAIGQNKKEENSDTLNPTTESTTTISSEPKSFESEPTTPFTINTTVGDTIKDPFYSIIPPTPEIIKLQQELTEMEKEFPQFEKEKEVEVVKIKEELVEMEREIAGFEKEKEVEIAEIEKELSGMKTKIPDNEKEKEAEIAEIFKKISKKEAELADFTKKIEEENKKIEAQIEVLKKERESKKTTKHDRLDGEIQGLYGEIQGNMGELQGKRGEIQGMHGEIQGIRGEMLGNRGELQGKHGEIQGLRGEIQGKRGEIMGKRGEIQGIRGEIMGKRGEIQGKRGEIHGKYTELVFKTLVADLKSDNLITDDKRLFLRLNEKEMYINQMKQSDAIHAKYKAKYLKGNKGFEIYKRDGNLNFSVDDEN
jgi:beta-lactamase regulating signal transducer with metallopeptidase domain